MAQIYPSSSLYLLKILAKSCFPRKSPSIWRPGLSIHLVSTASASVFQGFRPQGPETTFRAGSVVSVQEQHKSGVDQISHKHPCCDVVICKQAIQLYLLTAVFFCHVCEGGHGGLGQMSRSNALWNRIAEKPSRLDHCAERLCCQEPTSLILLQAQI